jgi:hypothetical protein
MQVGNKEQTMSRKAEDWLAEQEVALLEAIHHLESPPQPVDPRQGTTLEAQTVRVLKSRLSRDSENRARR